MNRITLQGQSGWFLVEAEQLPMRGGDGEPLVTSVTALKLLEWTGQDAEFTEVSPVDVQPIEDHPNFPECTCQSIDDFLAQT
jgi:hypothetical protein